MASLVERTANVYRSKGVSGVVKAARTRLTEQPYQAKPGMSERLALLESVIPEDAGSMLDIGCNIGIITAHFARRGLFCIGTDIDPKLMARARKMHADVENCAFSCSALTPDNVLSIPRFDVILVLSVHHNWMAAHGPEVAGQMLRDLVGRTTQLLVFEAPARNLRYGPHSPGFVDNDERTVTAFNESYLHEHLADMCSIEPLGKTPCWGQGSREPFRWSYALRP